MSDPLSAAIDAAVRRAIEAQIPKIVEAVAAAQQPPPEQPPPDRLLRLDEAAHMLGVHRTTLFRLQKSGKLPPPRKIGGAAGYLLSDLRAVLEEARREAA